MWYIYKNIKRQMCTINNFIFIEFINNVATFCFPLSVSDFPTSIYLIQIIVIFYGSSLSGGLKEKEKKMLVNAAFHDLGQNGWPHCLYLAAQTYTALHTYLILVCVNL